MFDDFLLRYLAGYYDVVVCVVVVVDGVVVTVFAKCLRLS